MKNWRLRSNYFKKLILQRLTTVTSEDARGIAYTRDVWRDATATDLQDYYLELFSYGGMLGSAKE